eukprot:CAMPEP_0196667354 /NCGR_PEP_ID=MMETSP1086-20130531/64894_1 /TAXON_ID=77921 /ORGANISM="Cyanoptyche  gloeocystis , Strain SAG4.97" /LENGTH=1099 /DNA_ID=CAMNT_0042004679 /DNA_START=67 /DNA_END=3366 /DNA_ORIENTATION=+
MPALTEPTVLFKFRVSCVASWGQLLQLKGSIPALQEGLDLKYQSSNFWTADVRVPVLAIKEGFTYQYSLKCDDRCPKDEVTPRRFQLPALGDLVKNLTSVDIQDDFRNPSDPSSLTDTGLFTSILFNRDEVALDLKSKAALSASGDSYIISLAVHNNRVPHGFQVCVGGGHPSLGGWDVKKSMPLQWDRNRQVWAGYLAVSKSDLPLEYKLLVCDEKFEKEFWEDVKENRKFTTEDVVGKSILARTDEFRYAPNHLWRGAGIVLPVFSLRSTKSLGIGEFLDLNLLVEWASKCGFCLIQLLPVNDSAEDASPYSAVSAFALHPVYLRLDAIPGISNETLKKIEVQRAKLNASERILYKEVLEAKMGLLKEIFFGNRESIYSDKGLKAFIAENRLWLYPYAAYRTMKELLQTPDYQHWGNRVNMSIEDMEKLTTADSMFRDSLYFWMFIQYHLHLQLLEAATFAKQRKVGIKGDLPIGVGKCSVDTWMHRDQFRMNKSAGAPPDQYSDYGQNWGFPTYDWDKMAKNGYSWWRARLSQMERYFCAFRIDHALGFFRIWEIPAECWTAILGQFYPCKPVTRAEFEKLGVKDISRILDPYITPQILANVAGTDADYIVSKFLTRKSDGTYAFRSDIPNEAALGTALWADPSRTDADKKELQRKAFALYHNVVIIRDQASENFQFRFDIGRTLSFQALPGDLQKSLKALYNQWLTQRQDDEWSKSAISKLQALRNASSMLVCGEDLGVVPRCTPPTLKELAIIGLRIMGFSVQPGRSVNVCADYEYLTICSPTCHDMSPLRLWYHEATPDVKMELCRKVLRLRSVPADATPEVCEGVFRQHVESPCILTMVPLQDVFAIVDGKLRAKDLLFEQINDPSCSKPGVVNWAYRMHITLEKLNEEADFTKKVADILLSGGRSTKSAVAVAPSKPSGYTAPARGRLPAGNGTLSEPVMFPGAQGTLSEPVIPSGNFGGTLSEPVDVQAASYSATLSEPVQFQGTLSEPVSFNGTLSEPVSYQGTLSEPVSFNGTLSEPVSYQGTLSEPVGFQGTLSEPVAMQGTLSEPVATGTLSEPVQFQGTLSEPVMVAAGGGGVMWGRKRLGRYVS